VYLPIRKNLLPHVIPSKPFAEAGKIASAKATSETIN